MKVKFLPPFDIVGELEHNKFKARVHHQARVIICSSEPVGGLLPNRDAERRARFISRRLLMGLFSLPMFFRFWLYVEAQTNYGEVTLKRIRAERCDGPLCATFDDLTPEESTKVEPLIQSMREQLERWVESQKPEWARKMDALRKAQGKSVSTPSPSATR
jgi:hypothetical protein